jgi:hypothetical protein
VICAALKSGTEPQLQSPEMVLLVSAHVLVEAIGGG